jgi:arginase family enzyme
MPRPIEYESLQPAQFGGALPEARSFDDSAAVILPAPLERTTSYGIGTRNGPRELLSSAQVEPGRGEGR